ncbi:MAG TPA: serine protease [Candidatus Angelobacter sp.]|nr:serine protease [Candidatus Angelobacter sp.]
MQEQYGKLGGYASKYPYLVGIRTESNNWGTGILISPLHVLTCAHVLDDETEPVEVISQEGRTSARPQKRENPPDLALLKLERPLLIPQATFTNSALQPGAVLLAAGAQDTPGQPNALQVAEIKLTFLNQNDADGQILDVQLEGGARHGYSGGPLLITKKSGKLLCAGILTHGGRGATTFALGLASIRGFVPPDIHINTDDVDDDKRTKRMRRFPIWAASLLLVGVGAVAGWHLPTSQEPAKVNQGAPVPTGDPTPSPSPTPEPDKTNHGDPNVKVWVNTSSGKYHCPGTLYYGRTKHGEYMTQAEAQKKGNVAAYGKVCWQEDRANP